MRRQKLHEDAEVVDYEDGYEAHLISAEPASDAVGTAVHTSLSVSAARRYHPDRKAQKRDLHLPGYRRSCGEFVTDCVILRLRS